MEAIDRERQGANLSSTVRVHLLEWMMSEGAFLLPDETAGDLSKD